MNWTAGCRPHRNPSSPSYQANLALSPGRTAMSREINCSIHRKCCLGQECFAELKYSSQMSKQKPLVRYILLKIYQANSKGLPIAQEKVNIEHLSPEHPAKSMGLVPEHVAS